MTLMLKGWGQAGLVGAALLLVALGGVFSSRAYLSQRALERAASEPLAAREALERAVRLEPANPRLHYELGNAHLRGYLLFGQGGLERALEAFSAARRLDPREALYAAGRGWVLLELGRLEQGRAAFEEALALDPHNQDYLYGLGQALERLRRPGEALRRYREGQAVKADPRFEAAIVRLEGR
ncbi:tetratricopeptide repeat protein [Calidithermus chliarophilus]|uniref:tetratricopeptide repeat protein n=1 Tax=Calidithermus chliarophilus TaxID=52023 RepID=UPI0003F52819|nr:tetratricopeptide repeat protein [Calidithermus chliarophilus]